MKKSVNYLAPIIALVVITAFSIGNVRELVQGFDIGVTISTWAIYLTSLAIVIYKTLK